MEDIAARLVEVLDALDLKESADADIDAYLDARDEDPFDSDWLSAHQELESRKRGLDEPSCASWNAPTGSCASASSSACLDKPETISRATSPTISD